VPDVVGVCLRCRLFLIQGGHVCGERAGAVLAVGSREALVRRLYAGAVLTPLAIELQELIDQFAAQFCIHGVHLFYVPIRLRITSVRRSFICTTNKLGLS
jgi:hypothetical protein